MIDDRFERSGLREKMRGTGDDLDRFRPFQPRQRFLIQLDYAMIVAAHDQQSWRGNRIKRCIGEIWPAAARDDGTDTALELSRGDECCCRASACAKKSKWKLLELCIALDPRDSLHEPLHKKLYVENICPIPFLLLGQKIEEQGRDGMLVEYLRHCAIAWAEAARAAAMNKDDQPTRPCWNAQRSRQAKRCNCYVIVVNRPTVGLSTGWT